MKAEAPSIEASPLHTLSSVQKVVRKLSMINDQVASLVHLHDSVDDFKKLRVIPEQL